MSHDSMQVIQAMFEDMVEDGEITLSIDALPFTDEFESLYQRVQSQGLSIGRGEVVDCLSHLRRTLDHSDPQIPDDSRRMICATSNGQEFEVIFRQINDEVPSHLNKGVHWQVEAWNGELLFPSGIAFVCRGAIGAFVEFVLVDDNSRQQGVGRMLVEAILAKWPGAYETPGISKGGEALAAWLKHRRIEYQQSRREP